LCTTALRFPYPLFRPVGDGEGGGPRSLRLTPPATFCRRFAAAQPPCQHGSPACLCGALYAVYAVPYMRCLAPHRIVTHCSRRCYDAACHFGRSGAVAGWGCWAGRTLPGAVDGCPGRPLRPFFRRLRGCSWGEPRVPAAYAAGYVLSPLRGCSAPMPAGPAVPRNRLAFAGGRHHAHSPTARAARPPMAAGGRWLLRAASVTGRTIRPAHRRSGAQGTAKPPATAGAMVAFPAPPYQPASRQRFAGSTARAQPHRPHAS